MAYSRLRDILVAMRVHLVADECVQDVRLVQFVARKKVPHLNGDRDILLRLKGLASPQDIVAGAGRLSRIYRNLDVVCRQRDARDKVGTDEEWLFDELRGQMPFEMRVLDSLQMFQPEDSDGSLLLLGEPMRLLDSTEPDRELENQGKAQGWGFSLMRFQMMYEPDFVFITRQ